MKQKLLYLLYFISLSFFAQQNVFVDFGNSSTVTTGNWNNIVVTSQNQDNIVLNLIDSNGANTGVTFSLTDSFDHINTNGTTSPNAALPFPVSATQDSFFGETSSGFNGNVNPTGGFTLSGLNPTKYYSFSVFSSRTAVGDNRETLYTVVGSTTISQALNPSNNTSNTADILNIQPDVNGEITFQAKPGPNNNNSFGFYYLGTLQLLISDTPISTMTPEPALALSYPNGGHIWQVDKTVRVKWQSISITDLLIELSPDNGANWSTIATVPANTQFYDMTVPNEVSSNCLLRISGEGLSDVSENTFEIIPNDGIVYRIVVLGSSTAAGIGPSDINNAWVYKYKTYLEEMDTHYEVNNLALGGYVTYNILPTGTPIPVGVSRTVDVNRNITKAIELNADGIIINMPSNDAASGYPVEDQVYNYGLIKNDAVAENIPLWVTTPQPRNFGTNTTNLNIQVGMVQATYDTFGNDMTVDFWTDLGVADNNGILPQYDAGDGIHMNDAGHQILFDRIIGKGIHTIVKNNVDNALNITEFEQLAFLVYPNPASDNITLKFSDQISNSEVDITIMNIVGERVYNSKYLNHKSSLQLNVSNLKSGLYFIKVNSNSNTITKKLIIN